MQRVCPYCGKELPEEASFCLNCFTQLNKADEPSSVSFPVGQRVVYSHGGKIKLISVLCAFTLIAAGVTAMYLRVRNSPAPLKVSENETVLVPLVDENGETVTNASGEAVLTPAVQVTDSEGNTSYRSVEAVTDENGEAVTDSDGNRVYAEVQSDESKTQKTQGLFDRLFGSSEQSNTATATLASAASKPASSATASAAAPTTASAPKTTAAPTTAKSMASGASSASAKDFTYIEATDSVTIMTYKGSSSVVSVPSAINGKAVTSIAANAFKSNSSVTKIIFEDRASFALSSGAVFNGLPNLRVIVLPVSTSASFNGQTVNACPKLEGVYFGSEGKDSAASSKYNFSIDGVVMSSNGYTSELVYYPQGKRSSSYTVPDRVTVIGNTAVCNNPYLKEFRLSSGISQIKSSSSPLNFTGCTALAAFTGSGNRIHTENGVLYFLNATTVNDSGGTVKYAHMYYPAGKTDTYFEFTKAYPVQLLPDCFAANPHLQTAKFFTPTYTGYSDNFMKSAYKPTALKKIIIPNSSHSGTGGDYLQFYITVEKY